MSSNSFYSQGVLTALCTHVTSLEDGVILTSACLQSRTGEQASLPLVGFGSPVKYLLCFVRAVCRWVTGSHETVSCWRMSQFSSGHLVVSGITPAARVLLLGCLTPPILLPLCCFTHLPK